MTYNVFSGTLNPTHSLTGPVICRSCGFHGAGTIVGVRQRGTISFIDRSVRIRFAFDSVADRTTAILSRDHADDVRQFPSLYERSPTRKATRVVFSTEYSHMPYRRCRAGNACSLAVVDHADQKFASWITILLPNDDAE